MVSWVYFFIWTPLKQVCTNIFNLMQISIHGADKAGIVAHATDALNKAGLNILNLESDLGGSPKNPVYVIHIEGVSGKGLMLWIKLCKCLPEKVGGPHDSH